MRILIVGAAGTFGRAIHQRLQERGHDIITVGRTTGDIRCDIADEWQLAKLWDQAGQVDAIVSAAGEVTYAPEDEKAHLGATHAAFGDFALWAARSSGSTISPRSRHSVPVQIAAHPTVCAW